MEAIDCSPFNIWLHQRENGSACADLRGRDNNHKASLDPSVSEHKLCQTLYCQDEQLVCPEKDETVGEQFLNRQLISFLLTTPHYPF